MKYYAQCSFLTGGWMTHWGYKEGFDFKEAAITEATRLGEDYIFTRVVDDNDVVVWVFAGPKWLQRKGSV